MMRVLPPPFSVTPVELEIATVFPAIDREEVKVMSAITSMSAPLAIAAGYLGLLSPICVCDPFALLFGILALGHIKKNPGTLGKGRAIFGIVMGSIFTLLILFVLGMAILEEM